MKSIKKHLNKQAGDTIVEVMLAIIVIGGTLGGAFAIANRSAKTTQANYERYQAQVIANNQAESLKQKIGNGIGRESFGVAINTTNPADITTNNLNCFNVSAEKVDKTNCEKQGSNQLYTVQIQCLLDDTVPNECTSGSNYSNYRIHVEWDSLNGNKDNVELFYGV